MFCILQVVLYLTNNFYDINFQDLLEMVVYLIYVDKFPISLMDQLLKSISGWFKISTFVLLCRLEKLP